MNYTAEQVRELLLEQAGFIEQDGEYCSGLLSYEQVQEDVETHLRYASLFRGMQSDVGVPDLIYEISGTELTPSTPCIYVKTVENPSPEEITALRIRLWNHGRIPTLWVVTESSVRVYDAFARPREGDLQDISSHMLAQLHCVAEQLTGIDEIHRSRFDSGDFWVTGAGKSIDPKQRVDQALLKDLSDTEELLRLQGLPPAVAHALLGRTIFVKYLEDRGILTAAHFRTHWGQSGFMGLLHDKDMSYSFFRWLHETFNGDLFPLSPAELESVGERHLDILHRFLSGHLMGGYPDTQGRLWPYSFEIIPIELISSIYEMFAHAGDSTTAETLSVHYTRFGLVELVLSLGMRNLSDTAKVFDPACGSGAFLVEAFRRLAWSRARRLGRPLDREELQELLRTQIFGMDIDRDAVYVAAFSLYLTLLEVGPTSHPHSWRLPQLIQSNLYVQDFFNTDHEFNDTIPFSNDGFDLIVSNPPWTALNDKTAPIDPESGVRWGLDYARHNEIPDFKPDQAFMLRAREFAGPQSIVAMIVASRIFHQTSTSGERWRNNFLENNTVHYVVDLSDLVGENLLFGWKSSTRLPASVVIFSPTRPNADSSIQYIAPKWYPGVRSRDEIILTSADIQTLSHQLLKESHILWKIALRGTPRDFQLLFKLKELNSLDDILDDVGIRTSESRGRGVSFGRGDQKDASHLIGKPYLDTQFPKQRYFLDAGLLPYFSSATIARKSNQLVLGLPSLVLSRALLDHRPCTVLVDSDRETELLTSQSYYGISFPESLLWLARRLNVVLNSKISLYWAFMTSPALGVDRKLIEVSDWRSVPMPETIQNPDSPIWGNILEGEERLRQQFDLGYKRQSSEALDELVYEVYGLSKQEIILVRDTVRYTIDPYLDRRQSIARRPPSPEQIIDYARRMCTQLNGILRRGERELSAVVCRFPQGAPLAAAYFALGKMNEVPLVREIEYGNIEDVLAEISNNLRVTLADNLYVQRDLRIYDGERFWIIKPAESRLWSEASALNDADKVVDEHMGETQ